MSRKAASKLPTFDNSRERTISSTSSILSSPSSSSSLSPNIRFASFYLGHLRRRPAFLLSLVALSLLILAALHKYEDDSISKYLESLRRNPFRTVVVEEDSVPEPPQPLTELGFEADYVYENIGSIDLDDYRNDLENFIIKTFPSSDADTSNSDSLLSILHTFIPPAPLVPIVHPQKALQHLMIMPWKWAFRTAIRLCLGPEPEPVPLVQPTIPKHVFQTGPWEGKEPPSEKLLPLSWKNQNAHYTYQYFDNAAAAEYIDTRFNESNVNDGKGGGIAETYWKMKDVPVMQSDFWRYAILATQGGVYSDVDTKCLKPIDQWHKAPWLRNLFENDPRPEPAIIVGIEVDVGSRADWHDWWPRPLGMLQWTIASTKGHPILIDTMRRVVEAIDRTNASNSSTENEHRKLDSVVEKTGPAPFTDSILRCELPRTDYPDPWRRTDIHNLDLGARHNVTWPSLRHVPNEGILFGHEGVPADVLVLSVTAFSPGVGNFGSGDVKSEAALVQHFFSGSWKHD